MRVLSRWIVGYGLLLLACNALDALKLPRLGLQDHTVIGSWPGALLVLAAGVASAQQRRSLRVGGLYLSIFLPLVLACTYAWIAAELWRDHSSSRLSAAVVSLLALSSIAIVWLIVRLRPREGIASRGYAVAIHAVKPGSAHAPEAAERRSEVG